MKIHFARPIHTDVASYEIDVLEKLRAEFYASTCPDQYVLTDSADEADLILFFESSTYKTKAHIANLLQEPVLQRHVGKLFTYNYQDGAAGFLDGVYVTTEKRRFVPGHHKAWSTLWPHNEGIYQIDDAAIAAVVPDQLCSFRGALSSPLRKKIAEHYKDKAGFDVTVIDRWYNHRPDEKSSYLDDILRTRFLLCPKGICSYTLRFFEIMALGRVPVLLADDWVAPENLDLASVAVVVPEKDYANLEEILHAKEKQAAELGHNGRRYWQQYFSKQVRLKALIDLAVSLQKERKDTPTMESYQERWNSFAFHWANDWTLPQSVLRRVRATVAGK